MTAPTPPEVREAAVLAAVTEALLITVLGTDDRDFLTGCDLPADEIARLIVEHGAAAAVAAYRATQDGGAEETLRDALRVHHPIMRSETGPFSGCRCGQVKLGQDVIGHVTDHLRATLAPQAGDGAR